MTFYYTTLYTYRMNTIFLIYSKLNDSRWELVDVAASERGATYKTNMIAERQRDVWETQKHSITYGEPFTNPQYHSLQIRTLKLRKLLKCPL